MLKTAIFLFGASWCVCEGLRATCLIRPPTDTSPVGGVVSFYQGSDVDDVLITVKISGLEPLAEDSNNLKHGFHIHQWGDITGGCLSTGGHYNPTDKNHGAPEDEERHVGDFGNLEQTADGRIDTTFSDPVATLFGPQSIIGRAVVLHELEDDLGKGGNDASLANGNAGARIGCCVIGIADLNT
ncbi:superoxide dismutase [Cu-Zn] [Elysia marginata]|uniref:Superoxide dismutase [Cu-Zn] n=1 Tax=Elysia marginata TaxID=1093978 RepID=A0AAV4IM05_9GAST|nr:superoxide dismutase [Cu-Zn] [Elysia marginata]